MPQAQHSRAGVPPIPAEHHKPWAKLQLPKEFAGHNPLARVLAPTTRYTATLDAARVAAQGPKELQGVVVTLELDDFGPTVKVTPPLPTRSRSSSRISRRHKSGRRGKVASVVEGPKKWVVPR
jgi:hypothetical protein